MKINLGVKPYLFPMPVLMIATYGEDDRVNVMNMAWGGICDDNKVALNISDTHKTADNLRARRAFTISVANQDHLEAADYFGMVTGTKVPDKFERTGLHAVRSERVDAPVVTEFPLTIECRVVDMKTTDGTMRVVARSSTYWPMRPCSTSGDVSIQRALTPSSSIPSKAATTPSAKRWGRLGRAAR